MQAFLGQGTKKASRRRGRLSQHLREHVRICTEPASIPKTSALDHPPAVSRFDLRSGGFKVLFGYC